MNDALTRIVRWFHNVSDLPDTEPRIELDDVVENDPALRQIREAEKRIRDLSDRMGRIGASGMNSADLLRGRYVPRRTHRPHSKGSQ